ncbi:MAG TPA: hypothetical protein VF712_17665 [Thermoleophilaceae bacterium]|jgi:hypothetical protein
MDLLARTLTAALMAFVLLALAATSADATHSRGKCKQRGSTVVKNDSARVFRRGSSLYGCLWSRNRAVLLDAESDDLYTSETIGEVTLRGRYVAWTKASEDSSCKADCPPDYDATTENVHVYELAARGGDHIAADPLSGTLRLNTHGTTAWLEAGAGGAREVHAWEFGRGSDELLDSGDVSRFRLRGRELSWLNAGTPHSVTVR